MNAIVMSGGEIKGGYEVGVLSEWSKHNEEPDYISGTSVGALNAWFLGVALTKGMNWHEAVQELVDFWREVGFRGSKAIARKRSLPELTWALVSGKWRGLWDMSALRRTMEEYAKGYGLMLPGNSHPRIDVCTVDYDSGMAVYHALNNMPMKHTIDMAMASAMMPGIMPPQEVFLEPHHYDGGVRDVAPLRGAVRFGAFHVLAIVTSPWQLGHHKGESLFEVLGRTLSIFVNEVTNNDLKKCWAINDAVEMGRDQKHRVIDLLVVRPVEAIKLDIFSFTPADIEKMIQLGRGDYNWISAGEVQGG